MKSTITKLLYPCFFILNVVYLCNAQVDSEIIKEIPFRNIGPAFMTGRISDIVKDPSNPSTWYVATASSNVWKTTNNGTTWKPIFDDYSSYSTGALAIDPNNPSTIWLGTGENQSQRSVGWGDGVYKSQDGGKSWKNMGLKESEHIGKILIDPRNPKIVIVAAQGPLWKSGGDRGIYRTSDGGENWEHVLDVSEDTGASDLCFDPNNPDVMYASTYQRRRHVGILVAGGPESRIYKSEDNGQTWKKVSKGLPGGDLGRIALAVSPQKSNVVYAHISASENRSGFYRSEDYGNSWKKTSDYAVVDPQYYGEIYCDPHRFDHVFVVDVIIHYTSDGGQNFQRLNTQNKHVDNHAMLFDLRDPDYLMVGCDGGIYESWDYGKSWKYHDNLPIMQFYRVGIDNEKPFYNVYGGTQDNSTIYGPSQTISRHGITNGDWTLALGGDGFQARIDPEDPNTVYCQSQYAGIIRYDRKSGHRTELQPQEDLENDPLRWHWDSPLIISPHNSKRLYFAAQRLFRSDDRGDQWIPISSDLSRGEDRNQREVMGKLWPPEAVWKNVFTSPYGTIVSLHESSLKEGLLVVGTDDGLIQITEDGGENWTRIEEFPGVPDKAYVSDVFCSLHNEQTIYATFNNHKEGDFKPYVLKSSDLGKSWTSINKGIGENHATWTIYEDHKEQQLLFLGTEFGVFTSIDGGESWTQMGGGLPTTPVRDIEIHQEENDLVLATFGRGFWILDDYSALRTLVHEKSGKSMVFDISDQWFHIPKGDKGYRRKGVFGDNFYSADNPISSPIIDVYIAEKLEGKKSNRKKDQYPDYETLKTEDFKKEGTFFVLLQDENGNSISKTKIPNRKGFHRISGNLNNTYSDENGKLKISGPGFYSGNLTAQLFQEQDGLITAISEKKTFEMDHLDLSEEKPSEDFYSFYNEVAEKMLEMREFQIELSDKINIVENKMELALLKADENALKELEQSRLRLKDMEYVLNGDQTKRSRFEYFHPGIMRSVRRVYNNMRDGMQITQTHRDAFEHSKSAFEKLLNDFKKEPK